MLKLALGLMLAPIVWWLVRAIPARPPFRVYERLRARQQEMRG